MSDDSVTSLHGRAAQANEAWQIRRPFPCVWVDDARARVVGSSYLIKGLLDELSLGLIYGPAGCGKTFFAIDVACSLAVGISWRGRRVKGGLVVYVAAEAGESILRGFAAWRDTRMAESREERIPLAVTTRAANLLNKIDVAELMASLQSIAKEAGMPLKLVIFDTLSRSIPGGVENSSHDMTAAVSVADRIRAELSAATLFVHHSGKDARKGARGHGALFAAADMVLSVADQVALVEKVRDGTAGDHFGFALKVVDLGQDEDGDAITTCVVEHEHEAARHPSAPPRLSPTETIALRALKEEIQETGELRPATSVLPPGKKSVRIEDWQKAVPIPLG